jgi:hypothetical protein
MGWWNVEGTKATIGDIPLDTLGIAVAEVVSQYQVAFRRRPTKAEWEALLLAVLGAEEGEAVVIDDALVKKVELVVE